MSTTALPERTKKLLDIWDRMKTNTVGFYELESFFSQEINTAQMEERKKRDKVEGMSALIKFIRNKARLDIMKVDLYGQGYYQAIKDMENYFGILEVDHKLANLKQELEKEKE